MGKYIIRPARQYGKRLIPPVYDMVYDEIDAKCKKIYEYPYQPLVKLKHSINELFSCRYNCANLLMPTELRVKCIMMQNDQLYEIPKHYSFSSSVIWVDSDTTQKFKFDRVIYPFNG